MTTITKTQLTAALEILRVVADLIREAGEIPSGEIYAAVMSTGMSLDGYTAMIDRLKGTGLIEEKAHVLRWVGPTI